MRHEGQPLDLGLRREHSVERVLVVRREFTRDPGVEAADWEFAKAIRRQIEDRVERRMQLPDLGLDDDFPKDRRADEDGVRSGNGPPGASGEPAVALLPPQQRVGVEEKPQSTSPLNADTTSAGRGS